MVPGALALGLLASLAAHGSLYHGEHAMGGAYHVLLIQLALAAILSFALALWSLTWSAAGRLADGSVLAARLNDRLPGFGPVLASAAFWYALGESVEPHHSAAPLLATVALLLTACWLVRALGLRLAAALARIVLAVARTFFSPRAPSWVRRPRLRPARVRRVAAHRRFVRPPPATAALTRA